MGNNENDNLCETIMVMNDNYNNNNDNNDNDNDNNNNDINIDTRVVSIFMMSYKKK